MRVFAFRTIVSRLNMPQGTILRCAGGPGTSAVLEHSGASLGQGHVSALAQARLQLLLWVCLLFRGTGPQQLGTTSHRNPPPRAGTPAGMPTPSSSHSLSPRPEPFLYQPNSGYCWPNIGQRALSGLCPQSLAFCMQVFVLGGLVILFIYLKQIACPVCKATNSSPTQSPSFAF